MKHVLLSASLLVALLVPAFASANPEPTAYDSRSIGMGLTGTTFMDQPAALALNPANLEGIPKLGFTFNFTNLLVNQTAPVQGPNTSVSSGLGYGPLPSGFIAGRIAPRVVFAGGIYIETGYGSSFQGVQCLDGDVVSPPPDNVPSTPDTNPPCTNLAPQDLDVTFFVGEFSTGFSFNAHEKFQLGLAVRLPWSKQTASLYQNVGAALGSNFYGQVKNNLGGVGVPAIRFGFTIKPHHKVRISAMYRQATKIKLTGDTETVLAPGAEPLQLKSEADWFIPHAVAFGVSYQANRHLLLAFEARFQFHGAEKGGNKNQTVTASNQDGDVISTVVVPFGWENTWSAKIGFEYRFTKDVLALRLGTNIASSATSGVFAQYFTPPPGLSGNLSGGLGFYWDDRNNPEIKDKYRLDLATAFAFTTGTITDEYINGPPVLIPGTDQSVQPCSDEQVVRTGCPGNYKVLTYWASVSFTLQY